MTPPDAPAPDRPAPDAPAPDAPVPGAPAPDAALAGVARATVDIAAPPERVFRALTDPAERARWWAPNAPAGAPADAPGAYRVLDPPRTIEHAAPAGPGGLPGVVRYDLAPVDVGGAPGTRVTVTHTAPALRAAAPRAAAAPRWLARRRPPAWAARAIA
jgi:uncharacterized protein YndB with AHSA1/START domain